MRLPNNVVAFAQNDVTLYEQFQDYFNHKHNKVGHFDADTKLTDKKSQLDESIKKEIAKFSNVASVEGIAPEVLATNPMYQWAAFAIVGAMVDAILPDTVIDSIGLYTDLRVGGFGDSFSFDIEARDLFVVSKYGNGARSAEVRKQFKGQVNIIPENRQITVQTSLYKVLCGLEDIADFAMKAARSLETQMTVDAFTAFNAAMLALPNTGDDQLRIAGYTQEDVVELCQKVTAFNGGRKAVIVGTQLALQNVLPTDTNYRYSLESDYVKIGYIKTAFGYDVMVLPQVADHTVDFKLALDDNNIYVLSPSADKLLKGALEGSTLSHVQPAQATANLTENVTFSKRWGFAVATSAIAGIITIA